MVALLYRVIYPSIRSLLSFSRGPSTYSLVRLLLTWVAFPYRPPMLFIFVLLHIGLYPGLDHIFSICAYLSHACHSFFRRLYISSYPIYPPFRLFPYFLCCVCFNSYQCNNPPRPLSDELFGSCALLNRQRVSVIVQLQHNRVSIKDP